MQKDRRDRIARASRDMLVTLAIDNLVALDSMDECVQQTTKITGRYMATATKLLDTSVLERLVSAEVLDALTPMEAALIPQLLSDLKQGNARHNHFYERVDGVG